MKGVRQFWISGFGFDICQRLHQMANRILVSFSFGTSNKSGEIVSRNTVIA